MSKKKASGTTKNGRDSNSKRLGFKKYSNQFVWPGNIILRQKSSKFYPGKNTKIGKDYTIYAKNKGILKIIYKKNKKYINIINDFYW